MKIDDRIDRDAELSNPPPVMSPDRRVCSWLA